MKKILAFTALSLFVLSCKKDKVEPTIPPPGTPSYSHVSTTGSYWVYEWYQVDVNGNETLLSMVKDTIRIIGDTTINGKIYQHYKGKDMNTAIEFYQRDSSGYIVNSNGVISYSYVSAPVLLHQHTDGAIKQWNYIGEKQTINTIAGVKEASTTYLEVSMEDGSPVNSCGDLSTKFYRHFVSGIGMVQKEIEYFSMMMSQCSKKRAKLSAYYIAP